MLITHLGTHINRDGPKKKKVNWVLKFKIMFGAFGPFQEHISPTRKDTPFNLIPNLIKK